MNMDKLAELVDKCASTRGAPAAAELFQHIAQLLNEDVARDSILDSSLRVALVRVAQAGAAARSNNPRAALALLETIVGRTLGHASLTDTALAPPGTSSSPNSFGRA